MDALVKNMSLSRSFLFVGTGLVIALLFTVASLMAGRQVIGSVWEHSVLAQTHFSQILRETAIQEDFVEKAHATAQQLLAHGARQRTPFDLRNQFQAVGPGGFNRVATFPWTGPFDVIRFDSVTEERESMQLAVAARLVLFDAAFWGTRSGSEHSYIVAQKGSMAVVGPVFAGLSPDAQRSQAQLKQWMSSTLQRFENVLASEGHRPPDRPLWTGLYVHPITQQQTLTSFMPIRDRKGQILAFVATDLELMGLAKSIASQGKLAGGYSLFTERGDFVVGSGYVATRRAFAPEGHTLEVREDSVLQWRWSEGSLLIRKSFPTKDWHVLYSIPLAKALEEHQAFILRAFGGMLILSALVLYASLLIDRRILLPAMLQARRLMVSEAFNRAVIEAAPMGLLVIDNSDKKILIQNELSRQMVSVEPQGRTLMLGQLMEAFTAHSSGSVELAVGDEREGPQHFAVSFAEGQYQDSHVVLCALLDITPRRRMEETLAQAKAEAEQANEAKSSFLAMISHELRTPLYGTPASLELMSAQELNAEQRGLMGMMEGSARSLLQLINDLLDFTKIEAEQLSLAARPFVLLEELEQLVRSFVARSQALTPAPPAKSHPSH